MSSDHARRSRPQARALRSLVADIRACRLCVEAPRGRPLPHEPRPVLRVSTTARIAVVGQAPGTRVHASGTPFTDPSGVRLRAWMGVSDAEFYDESRIAIIPMGFCFPGLGATGGDLPPRPECAPRWRPALLALLPQIELMLLVGTYAQRWHLAAAGHPHLATGGLEAVIRSTAALPGAADGPRLLAMPHPSWRNNAWLKRNPWFEGEIVPELQRQVRALLGPATGAEAGRADDRAAHAAADTEPASMRPGRHMKASGR